MVLQPINKPPIYSSFSNISPESGNPAFILCHRSPAIMFDIMSSSQYIKNALPNDRAYAPAFKLPHHNMVTDITYYISKFFVLFQGKQLRRLYQAFKAKNMYPIGLCYCVNSRFSSFVQICCLHILQIPYTETRCVKLRHCICTKEKTQWIFLYDSAIIYIDPRRA